MIATLLALSRAGRAQTPTPGKYEWSVVPLAGGDTDIGFGGGAIASVARVAPGVKPFVWRVDAAALFTFKLRGSNDFESPYQDVFVQFTRTGLMDGRLRLELRPAYTRESNLRYHGLGDAIHIPDQNVPARDYFTRTHPTMVARGRYTLGKPFFVALGTTYTQSWVDYKPGSTLANDIATGSDDVRSVLRVDHDKGLHIIESSGEYDTRDDEVSSTRGQFHQVRLRVAPWGTSALPYRYIQFTYNGRVFTSPVPGRLVLAARLVGDLIAGDAPFYELARYDETFAIGGSKGVRGVPAGAYFGKRKVLSNLEARLTLAHFTIGKSPYVLGAVGFFDAGRVWADLRDRPALDGTGVGLKYGTGGGLRVRKGDTFVLRIDLAWSPDARPIGFYFLAEQMF